MSIAYNIKKLREEHGLSQAEFGAIAGVSDKAVSTWELGLKVPRMGAIQKLADHFGITKSYIIEDRQQERRVEVVEQINQAPKKTANSLADMILDAECRATMSRYAALNDEKKKQVRAYVKFLSEER